LIFLCGAVTYLQRGACVDDAYVSFVFARNLADGAGLVFNLGDRIEGYSNFLWVLILGGLRYFTGVSIPMAARIIGAVLAICNVLLVLSIARRVIGEGSRWALAAAVLTAVDLRVAAWSVEGLETPLYLFWVLVALRLYLARRGMWLWGVAALGAALTRPEGAILFCALVVHRAIVLIREKRTPAVDIAAVLIFALPFAAYNAWRIIYFGSGLFPNTFYARGDAGPLVGLIYISLELWRGWGPVAALLIAVTAWGALKGATAGGALMVWVVAGTTMVIIVGGDWMPNARFLVPLLPSAFILAAAGCEKISRPKVGMALMAILLATQVVDLVIYEAGSSFEKRWSRNQDEFYMPVARKLEELGARGALVALSDIGYITYHSGIRVVDTLGLVDRHLARMPGGPAWNTDLDYVMGRRPRFVVTMVRRYGRVELGHVAFDRAVLDSGDFMLNYRLETMVPGYKASELSYDDLKRLEFKRRDYEVEFGIWRRKTDGIRQGT